MKASKRQEEPKRQNKREGTGAGAGGKGGETSVDMI